MGYTWEDPFNSLSFDELQDNKQCILFLFFSNDAKIINHSWISKSYVLIGYPSKKDEPICQTCESPSSHFTRLDQLHASGNTFINLLVIVSLEIKKHINETKNQCTCLFYSSSAVIVTLMMQWKGTGKTAPFQL